MNLYPPLSRIAGRYEVAGRPLLGGMGIVYLCLDRQTQRPVALKTFRPEFLPDRPARDRFLREGTTWVNLGNHPHIVRCYTVVQPSASLEVYLVLELVAKEEGRRDASLRSWLTPGKPLPIDQALLFALQIVRGMRHATETLPGFVHRDLKPENVLVGADRLTNVDVHRLRVTDFGLAAALQEMGSLPPATTASVTESGASPGRTQLTRGIVGTPLYMAPEQWTGGDVSAQTDMYAVGCMLHEMLTGQRAVAGDSLAELERAHRGGQVRALPTSVPPAVGAVIARCLAVEARARYGSWSELESVLAAAYTDLAGRAVPEAERAGALARADRVAAGWAHNAMGVSYLDIGKADVAVDYFERVVEAGRAEGERALEAAGLGNLGIAYVRLGDARRAVGYYEQHLAIAREIGDRHGEGNALGNLGNAYIQLGDARRAVGYYEQCLAIAREIGDRHGEGAALGSLGGAYRQLGDARRAVGYHEQHLAIAREIGDRHGEGAALGNLGNACLQLGDARRAVEYFEQRLAIAREIGNRHGEGAALGNLGIAYAQLGDARRAVGYYEQDLAIAREIGDRHGEGAALGNLGNAYVQLGDARRAVGYYEQHLAIAREIGDRHGEGAALGNLGNACLQLGDARRAVEYFEQRLAIAREIGDRHGEGAALGNLGIAYAQLGDARRAVGYYEQDLAIAREIGDRHGEGAALGNLGNACLQLGDARRAVGYYEQRLAIAREIGDRQGEALGSWNLGLAYETLGDLPRAIVALQACVDFEQAVGHPDAAKHAAKVAALRARVSGQVSEQSVPANDDSGSANAGQAAFEAFQRASTAAEMQQAVAQYPFMTTPPFIRAIEQAIQTQVPPQHQAAFQQRLDTLKSLAREK